MVGRGEEINSITTNKKRVLVEKLDEEGMCLAVQNMADSRKYAGQKKKKKEKLGLLS